MACTDTYTPAWASRNFTCEKPDPRHDGYHVTTVEDDDADITYVVMWARPEPDAGPVPAVEDDQ